MNDKTPRTVNEWANLYAGAGFPVLAVKPSSKQPLTQHGLHDATTDLEQIAQWFSNWPDANIGIRTGRASGLVVLDIDPRHGGDTNLQALLNEHGPLPETLSVSTGGGGGHLYFAYPEGVDRIKSRSAIAGRAGIDVKADNGYVVAPPSIHESGRQYKWDMNVPLAPIPSWLLALLLTEEKVDVHPLRPNEGAYPVLQDTVEQGLLAAVGQDAGRWAALEASGISADDFTSNRDTYLFMKDYLSKQGGLPSADILRYKFSWQPPEGDFEYWLSEMQRYSKARTVLEAIQNVYKRIANPEAAVRLFQEEAEMLSARLGKGLGRNESLEVYTPHELAELAGSDEEGWLLRGWLRKGAVTELAGKVKTGKSTWAGYAVEAISQGGAFMGVLAEKAATIWITEENSASFVDLLARCGLMEAENLYILPSIPAKLKGTTWPSLIDQAVAKAFEVKAWLLVIDNLSAIAGVKDENSSSEAIQLMAALQRAAASGLAVLVLRHDRKSGGEIGDSARGSSGYSGAVDIVLDLKLTTQGEESTARELSRVSRFTSAPKKTVVIDLEDGQYQLRGSTTAYALDRTVVQILTILPKEELEAFHFEQICGAIDGSRSTVQRALDNLINLGKVVRSGMGRKNSPYSYYQTDPKMPSAQAPSLGGRNEFALGIELGHLEEQP